VLVKKTKAGGTWTSARYFSFIRSALRRAFVKYPVRYQALEKARRLSELSDKRTKWEYQCNHCKKWFKQKDIQVDHIKECGSLKTYRDLPRFVKTLFCEAGNLQVLCKPCHKGKTYEKK
jgi:5-methylcytosine-specific restriction endonuclease McrA